MATTETLPRPPCPWTYAGAPLSCDMLDAPTTYRVRYELRPDRPDAYSEICIETLGGSYPGKVRNLPTCAEHDAAVTSAYALLGVPGAPSGGWVRPHAAPARDAIGSTLFLAAPGTADGGIVHFPVFVPAASGYRPTYPAGGRTDQRPPEADGTTGAPTPNPEIHLIPVPAAGTLLVLALLAIALWRRPARRG